MRKLISNIHKELLILVRDLPGLAILFLMPLLLIIVVTLTQQNAIQSVDGSAIEILFINHDNNTLGDQIRETLTSTNEIVLVVEHGGHQLNDSTLRLLLSDGKFKSGLIIPENTTIKAEETIISDLQQLITGEEKSPDSIGNSIQVLFDPGINNVLKLSINNAVILAIQGAESYLMTGVLFQQLAEVIETEDSVSMVVLQTLQAAQIDDLPQNFVQTETLYAGDNALSIKPSITQNNVPAFTLFAMFFIVIPLAGSLIAEKNEGTYDRIRSLPVSYFNILMGKTLAYLLVCILQFVLMVIVGVYLFPAILGLPALQVGNQYLAILLATLASALAAIGFGLLVGTYSSTHNQAAMLGAVLVVILAALGGIFMPTYMMPENLKFISNLSPLRWGIDTYLDIFVRGAGLDFIWKNLLLLLGFFAISMAIASKRFGNGN